MTDFGLLMTGFLSSTQPNLPNLPEQQPFKIENGVQSSKNNKSNHTLSELPSNSQVTPPEFMTTDKKEQDKISALANKRNQIITQIRQKHLSSISVQTVDAQTIPQQKQVTKKYSAYNRATMPTLRFGSRGTSVRIVQRLLVYNGYGIKIDGIFGPLTEAAIKAFQNQRNLLVDGVVGKQTWLALSK